MATKKKNLSLTQSTFSTAFSKLKLGIVVSEWNQEVTFALLDGAKQFLIAQGVKEKNITEIKVPGAFELPLGAQWLAAEAKLDGVIAVGCVIQGETRHFDFICDAVANGIMDVGLTFNKPVIFGVLTTQNMQQAMERAGGKHGNKGTEAADTLLRMFQLRESKQKSGSQKTTKK